jgi:hypothetical protein
MALLCEPQLDQKTLIIPLDSLSKIKQMEKPPHKITEAVAASDLNLLLLLLASGKFDKVVLAHLYSHTESDPRMDRVDEAAKEAAATASQSTVEDAWHWWKDDCRSALTPVLSARAADLLKDTVRGKFGPNGPSIWGKGMNGLSLAQCRRLAQVRVFCCSGLGGHLVGDAHTVLCGLCGHKCGRALQQGAKLQTPVEHLFVCPGLSDLRQARELFSPKSLWKADPKKILAFVDEAAALSSTGPFQRGLETLGSRWGNSGDEAAVA